MTSPPDSPRTRSRSTRQSSALGSFEHVTPNPFSTRHAFYAGDTGGAILGKHVDIYDWHGRAAQDAWGVRHVTVTPAPNPGTGNLLDEITPPPPPRSLPASQQPAIARPRGGPLELTAGQTAEILPDGTAAAPRDAPPAVKLAIAAGNQIIQKPYLYGGGHGQPLTTIASSYDCSSSTSFVLHGAGVFGDWPADSTELESYGQPGPGELDHRVRELRPRVHPDRRDRAGHRLVRTSATNQPGQRPALAARLDHRRPIRRRSQRIRATPPPRPLMPAPPTTAGIALLAVLLTGCGIRDPYTNTTATSTPTAARSTAQATSTVTNADPAPERGGTIPQAARAAQSQLAASAGAPTPQAALERYASRYVNWTAQTVTERPAPARRDLARASPRPSAPGRRQLRP